MTIGWTRPSTSKKGAFPHDTIHHTLSSDHSQLPKPASMTPRATSHYNCELTTLSRQLGGTDLLRRLCGWALSEVWRNVVEAVNNVSRNEIDHMAEYRDFNADYGGDVA